MFVKVNPTPAATVLAAGSVMVCGLPPVRKQRLPADVAGTVADEPYTFCHPTLNGFSDNILSDAVRPSQASWLDYHTIRLLAASCSNAIDWRARTS